MRKYARAVARANMEREGIQNINRHGRYLGRTVPSLFSKNWRKYAFIQDNIRIACKKERDAQARYREIRNRRRAARKAAAA